MFAPAPLPATPHPPPRRCSQCLSCLLLLSSLFPLSSLHQKSALKWLKSCFAKGSFFDCNNHGSFTCNRKDDLECTPFKNNLLLHKRIEGVQITHTFLAETVKSNSWRVLNVEFKWSGKGVFSNDLYHVHSSSCMPVKYIPNFARCVLTLWYFSADVPVASTLCACVCVFSVFSQECQII